MKKFLPFLLLLFTTCNKDDLSREIETDFFMDREVEVVFENDLINGINVIFLGDGYTKSDLGKKYGSYKKNGWDNIKVV